MKKKILAMLLAVMLILTTAACGSSEPAATPAPAAETPAAAGMANPVNTVAGYNELLAAQPTIKLSNAPEGASNVVYSWINNIPVISQIEFSYNGANYTYRAAPCPNGTASVDISGVYTNLPSVSTIEVNEPNVAGGNYVLRYDSMTGEGVANWTLAYTGCQYSLYTDKGCAGEMPITALMKSMYTCTVGAVKATATVLSVTGPTVAVTLESGDSAVLDTTNIKTITVKTNDEIEFTYLGDLSGAAQVLSITKTGEGEDAETNTFRGTIHYVEDDCFFASSSDNNVFVFYYDEDTEVSGSASIIAEGEVVTVTYTGNLYDAPKATEIYVERVLPETTSTPKPTVKYIERTCSGTVTSVGGIYVSVNGILFTVNGAECYVSGTPYVGGWATINYRDYGNGKYVVTSAYFGGSSPTPVPYTQRSTQGNVDYVSSSGHEHTVSVNGLTFTFNTRGISGSGTPTVGSWANIIYNDYGNGYYEVTEAYFSGNDPQPVEYRSTYGTVTSYDSSGIVINGIGMRIGSDCVVSGNYTYGCNADVLYRHSPDMSHDADEAYSISFYSPQPEYTDDYTEGRVTSCNGTSFAVNGINFDLTGASYSGTPQVDAYARVNFRNYNNQRVEVTYASFDPLVLTPAESVIAPAPETTPAG